MVNIKEIYMNCNRNFTVEHPVPQINTDSDYFLMQRGSSAFLEPRKFSCFLVMDPCNPASVDSAVRYWGRTIQSGGLISGAFGISSPNLNEDSIKKVKEKLSPMPFASIPHLPFSSPLDWNSVMLDSASRQAQELLSLPTSSHSNLMSPVKFNSTKKLVTLLMPGFDKSEIKLYQVHSNPLSCRRLVVLSTNLFHLQFVHTIYNHVVNGRSDCPFLDCLGKFDGVFV